MNFLIGILSPNYQRPSGKTVRKSDVDFKRKDLTRKSCFNQHARFSAPSNIFLSSRRELDDQKKNRYVFSVYSAVLGKYAKSN